MPKNKLKNSKLEKKLENETEEDLENFFFVERCFPYKPKIKGELEEFLLEDLKNCIKYKEIIDSENPIEDISIAYSQKLAIADGLLDACLDINYKGLDTAFLTLVKENKNYKIKDMKPIELLKKLNSKKLLYLSKVGGLSLVPSLIASIVFWIANPYVALQFAGISTLYCIFSIMADNLSSSRGHKKLGGSEYELNPVHRGKDGEYKCKTAKIDVALGLLSFGLPITGFLFGTEKYLASANNVYLVSKTLKETKQFFKNFKKYKVELF